MKKVHSDRWFSRWERRINEPFRNTLLYNCIPGISFIVIFLVTKDYYHGWQAFLLSILDISIFFRFSTSWTFILDVLLWIFAFIVQVISLYLFIRSFVNIGRCKYYESVFYSQSADYLGSARAVTFTGPPGCGKTFSSAANFATVIAAQRWEKLKSDYFLQRGMFGRWIEQGEVDKLEAFRSLEESYLFFAERESNFIPCLVSSLPIQDRYGRFSYVLTDEVASQIVRVPEYSVLLNDESGDSQGCDTSISAAKEIREFYRFNRHFGDFYLLNTEQGDTGNGKYIRIVTDYNIRLQRQKWIMPPNMLLSLLSRAKNRYFRHVQSGKISGEKARYLGQRLYYLEKWAETVGFRAIPYTFSGSDGEGAFEKGTYIFPAIGMGKYDSRAYRGLYRAKDKEITLDAWTSLTVEGRDEAGDSTP